MKPLEANPAHALGWLFLCAGLVGRMPYSGCCSDIRTPGGWALSPAIIITERIHTVPVTFSLVGGWKVTLTYEDVSRNPSTTTFYLSPAASYTEADTYVSQLAQKIELLTDARILNYALSRHYSGVGATAAQPGGNVEQKGVFAFRTIAGKTSILTVPAPKVAKMKTDERSMEETETDVADLISFLVNGDGTVQPVDSNAQDLSELLYTKVRHRSSVVG
jgi:hypothetical protein